MMTLTSGSKLIGLPTPRCYLLAVASCEMLALGPGTASLVVPAPDRQAARSRATARSNGLDDVRRVGEHVEGNHAVVFSFDQGSLAVQVSHLELSAEFRHPSRRQVNDEGELPVAIVVGVRSKKTVGSHGVRTEIVACTQGHAGDRLEECLELGALERHAELQIGKSVRARLELRRRANQLSVLEESILVLCAQPILFLHSAFD